MIGLLSRFIISRELQKGRVGSRCVQVGNTHIVGYLGIPIVEPTKPPFPKKRAMSCIEKSSEIRYSEARKWRNAVFNTMGQLYYVQCSLYMSWGTFTTAVLGRFENKDALTDRALTPSDTILLNPRIIGIPIFKPHFGLPSKINS